MGRQLQRHRSWRRSESDSFSSAEIVAAACASGNPLVFEKIRAVPAKSAAGKRQ